ncbi:Transmembrane protein 132C [Sarcoptes scabiei]|nr:Transmembrane protein 132C [Sarcoptes scabiei]
MRSIIFFFILSSIKLSECIPSSSHVNTGLSAVARSEDGHGNYAFGYNEDHSTGGSFRKEKGGPGVQIGSYGLRNADGRMRVVNYVADANGFRASVSSNEPGIDLKQDSTAFNLNINHQSLPEVSKFKFQHPQNLAPFIEKAPSFPHSLTSEMIHKAYAVEAANAVPASFHRPPSAALHVPVVHPKPQLAPPLPAPQLEPKAYSTQPMIAANPPLVRESYEKTSLVNSPIQALAPKSFAIPHSLILERSFESPKILSSSIAEPQHFVGPVGRMASPPPQVIDHQKEYLSTPIIEKTSYVPESELIPVDVQKQNYLQSVPVSIANAYSEKEGIATLHAPEFLEKTYARPETIIAPKSEINSPPPSIIAMPSKNLGPSAIIARPVSSLINEADSSPIGKVFDGSSIPGAPLAATFSIHTLGSPSRFEKAY